jgi:undecaprenyl-diphosphatase
MITEILLAFIQAATEFLPVSSSGHLALASYLLSASPNLFFFTVLHLASLLAVIIFTHKEISSIFRFDEDGRKLLFYLAVATLPAVLFVLFFGDIIKQAFTSMLVVGIGFLITGCILFATKFTHYFSRLGWKNSLFIGIVQMFAIFPGISRSGLSISAGMFSGLKKEGAAKFSFLLFIPLAIGAVVYEFGQAYFSWSLVAAFIICFVLSLLFLNLLYAVVRKGKFWIFAIYCWLIGLATLAFYFKVF